MNFIIHNTSGEILRTGSCPEEMFFLQAKPGESVIEGMANIQTQYIVDGIVINYTPEEILLKNSVSYGCRWAMPEKSVVQYLPDEEIVDYLATQVRVYRSRLLSETDWTQTFDQSEATKTKYAPYRLALRDITAQQGFPLEVVFPELPQ